MDCFVAAHGQRQIIAGPCQTTSSEKDLVTQGRELLEHPHPRPLPGMSSLARCGCHLQLTPEIVRQYRRHHEVLVGDKVSAGNVVELRARLQLPDDSLLRTTPVVEHQYVLCSRFLFGDDDLVVELEIPWLEDVGLEPLLELKPVEQGPIAL